MSLFQWIPSPQKSPTFKMKLLQKFVIQNAKFSKCLLTNRGVSLLILTKHFEEILNQSLMIIMIIQTLGFIPFSIPFLIIHGLLILTKHFQKILNQSLMIVMIIQTLGFIHFSIALLMIHGFFIGVMKLKIKMIFQIGF